MTSPPLLVNAVEHVLNMKARNGSTTKHDAALLVHGKIEKAGGPTKFGIGAAALRMALMHVIENEVGRQLKLTMTDHEYRHVLPASTPMEIIATIGRAPRWIAINEGIDAIWKFSLHATPDDWRANAALKHRKAAQTLNKARESEEIALFLSKHNFSCLAEAMGGSV